MSKYKVVIMAMFAVFAFTAIAASSAMALKEEWLKSGSRTTLALPGLLDGEILLVHSGGLLGSSTIRCTGQFHGTYGPGAADTITEMLSLSGGRFPLPCEFTSGPCGVGSRANAALLHLPWDTKLELPGSPAGTWDKISEGGGKGAPGFEVECVSLKVGARCEGSFIRMLFESNGTNGAILDFHGIESGELKCNDGGTGSFEGGGEVLGFTIS